MMKKVFYIFSLVFALLLAVGCEDDNTLNTYGGATVSVGQATYTVKENKGLFNIPIHVSGDRNGAVEVDVDVVCTDNSCQEDVHYLVTSKHIIIPHYKNVGYVEIKAVDDRVINADRQFALRIVNVQGAQLKSSASETLITLTDNDDIPYDRMDGKWTVTATCMMSGPEPVQVSWTTRLKTAIDESEEGYGSIINMSPWRTWYGETYEELNISHDLIFKYNAASQTATLSLKLGQEMGKELPLGREDENGYDLRSCTLHSATSTPTGYTTNGSIVGSVNEDFTQIVFNLPIIGLIYDSNEKPYTYWFYYQNVVLTREP